MKVINRKAKFDYQLLDRFEAGIVLTGAETKSAKAGQIKLDDSFVQITDQGVLLINSFVNPYKYADNRSYDPQRSRQLLLHQQEILSLTKKMEAKNLTLVPTMAYTKAGRVKLEIALAKGKKKWDKRETIKRREQAREAARAMRQKV